MARPMHMWRMLRLRSPWIHVFFQKKRVSLQLRYSRISRKRPPKISSFVIAYERRSLREVPTIVNFTYFGILENWSLRRGGRLREWSQPDVQLYMILNTNHEHSDVDWNFQWQLVWRNNIHRINIKHVSTLSVYTYSKYRCPGRKQQARSWRPQRTLGIS